MIDNSFFDKYLTLENNFSSQCITNYTTRFVYRVELDGEVYFIKKYIPRKSKRWRIFLGLQKDPATHYKFISDKLKKLGIPHAEPVYTNSKYIGFNKVSILVTKYCGIDFEKNFQLYTFEEQVDFVRRFYAFYRELYKNNIYATDYNLESLMINENKELSLLDFDCFKYKRTINKKRKEHLKKEVKKAVNTAFLLKDLEINKIILEELDKIYKMIDES